jgi:signal transduction histidine kinase
MHAARPVKETRRNSSIFPWQLRLAQRIVLSVAVGLALILVFFGTLAVWTIQQATATEYAARLQITRTLAAETDDAVLAAQESLQRAAARLAGWSGHALTPLQQTSLQQTLLPDGDFSTVELLDGGGNLRWSGSTLVGVAAPAWMSLPFVSTARTQGVAQAGECPDDETPGQQALCLASPLVGSVPMTILVAELDAREGSLPLVPPAGGQPDAAVQVLDASGRVIAGSGQAAAGEVAEHVSLLSALLYSRQAGVLMHQPGPGDAFPPHLVAYVPLQRVPGWGIALEVPQDEVLAAPRLLAGRLALFGVGALLLASAVAWLDVHQVVRPLLTLTRAADLFAAGRLDVPVTLSRRDELGRLATAFETMRQRLQASLAEVERGRQELERRVAERTKQVEEQNRSLASLNAEAARLNAALQQRTAERAALLSRVLSAQEGERQRIARGLHDSTGQSLAAVLLSLELLDEQLPVEPSAVRRSLRRSRELATSTLTELRALIAGLRPALLDDLGLVPALRAFATQRLEEHGVDVRFDVALPKQLPPAVEIALFRIVQEALSNIAKHAHARQVTVHLGLQDGQVQTTITDDGVGFDTAQVYADALHGTHVGLLGMRERAELLGGRWQVTSASGAGATVSIIVPLAAWEVPTE